MHGLKGLEFKNTIIIDLEDNKFPGVDLKEDGMTEEQLIEAESEARRLFYVAITRAKENLHLMFHRANPTRYIRYFIQNNELAKVYHNCVDDIGKGAEFDYIKTNNYTTIDDTNSDFIFTENLPKVDANLSINATDYKPDEISNSSTNDMFSGLSPSDSHSSAFPDINLVEDDDFNDIDSVFSDSNEGTTLSNSNTSNEVLTDVNLVDDLSIFDDSTTSNGIATDNNLFDNITSIFGDESNSEDIVYEKLSDNDAQEDKLSETIDTSTSYDSLRDKKPKLTSILDILRDKSLNG